MISLMRPSSALGHPPVNRSPAILTWVSERGHSCPQQRWECFVELDQIQAIEAAGKYAVVHVGKENHVLRETMSSLESHLPPQRFLRISRSVIVNIDQIQELQPTFKGENLVVLKNRKSYPTTRPIREIQQRLEFR